MRHGGLGMDQPCLIERGSRKIEFHTQPAIQPTGWPEHADDGHLATLLLQARLDLLVEVQRRQPPAHARALLDEGPASGGQKGGRGTKWEDPPPPPPHPAAQLAAANSASEETRGRLPMRLTGGDKKRMIEYQRGPTRGRWAKRWGDPPLLQGAPHP